MPTHIGPEIRDGGRALDRLARMDKRDRDRNDDAFGFSARGP